jgi:pimeloyl-ACP methyl ester carboxylesterase
MSEKSPITLVLLPGMDGTGLLFAPFLRAMPEWVKPVVVSYPGDRPMDYAGHLEIVMAVLPKEGPFVILGESFSGPLALMAAAQRPAGLRGVILCATFVTWPLAMPVFVARLAVAMGIFKLKSTRIFSRVVMGNGATSELREMFPMVLERLTPDVLASRARAVMDVDCREELRDCHVPVLALVSERDRIVAKHSPALMREVKPDLEMAGFDSPHLILQLDTARAVERICRFLQDVK